MIFWKRLWRGLVLVWREARRGRDVEVDHYKDPLTGVWNRRTFEDLAQRAIKIARRHEWVISVLVMDLDGFKTINDLEGHSEGDETLRRFGQILSVIARKDDWIGRWGGDEFVAVFLDTDESGARSFVERTRACPKCPAFSCGIVTHQSHAIEAVELADLVKEADALMFEEKQGRPRLGVAPVGVH